MSRGSSENFLNVVNREYPNDIFIHLVTIFWPDGGVSQFAKNYKDVESRGTTYEASSFDIQLPEEPDDSIPQLNFSFGVVERDILDRLNQSTRPPELRVEVVLASDPDAVELGPFDFDIREYQTEGAAVNITAGFEPILDLAIPQLSFNPQMFPGLFKDVRGKGGDLDVPTGTTLPVTSSSSQSFVVYEESIQQVGEATIQGDWVSVENINAVSSSDVIVNGEISLVYSVEGTGSTDSVDVRIFDGGEVAFSDSFSGGSYSSSFSTNTAGRVHNLTLQVRGTHSTVPVPIVGNVTRETLNLTGSVNNRSISVDSRS